MTPPEHLSTFFTRDGEKSMQDHAGLSLYRTETFGTLDDDEILRGVAKHTSRRLAAVSALAGTRQAGPQGAQLLKMGLKMECYATPRGECQATE